MVFSSLSNDVLNNLDYVRRDDLSIPGNINSERLPSTLVSTESGIQETSTSFTVSHNNYNESGQNVGHAGGQNKQSSQPDKEFLGALKEWAIVCKAIEAGDQILLFRKGGIMEFRNGFELKFKNFFLFPTFEHQAKESIRPEYHMTLDKLEKDSYVKSNNNNQFSNNSTEITSFVEITHFNEVPNLDSLKELEQFHIWTDDYLKTRFNYNPKKPLYMLLLRAYKLNKPIQIVNKPQWVGCKSWIQIESQDPDLTLYFENHLPDNPFEYLKSISNPCIDDIKFNKLSEKVRNVIK
ncbi:MAG TPA: DUF1802 family protein [Candidatus Saccharimonadales bacterium]|nr:DUF1802 family protein [Candidatus Saccharimonadales bacterium]